MKSLQNLFEVFPEIDLDHYKMRGLDVKDFKDVFEIYSKDEVLKYQGIHVLQSAEQAIPFINQILRAYDNKLFIRWAIEEKSSNKLIGLVALHHIDHRHNKAQIGYILNQGYWQEGIMSRVLGKAIDYLFENTTLNRIEAEIHPDNLPSIRLSEKLGFLKEGHLCRSFYDLRSNQYEDRVLMGLVKK